MDPLSAGLEEHSYQSLPQNPTMGKDLWLAGCDSARVLADQIQGYLQERVFKYPNGGPEASRLTAKARRLLASLASQIQRLREGLDEEIDNLSKAEKNRRNDIITNLNLRREQMLDQLSKTYAVARGELLGSSNAASGPAQDTEETADLDSRGLLQLQKEKMQEQVGLCTLKCLFCACQQVSTWLCVAQLTFHTEKQTVKMYKQQCVIFLQSAIRGAQF
eukprot:TRINITY_DN2151_c0_g2_i2.p1 TRINITY_DN2151_c0_g2~~TRINITY_DN2151_c0_g2_i2.p1  ORF type:complete len:219 (+),score=27.60 TRINITY_DN2151_c0_g2_i2:205-861(+)